MRHDSSMPRYAATLLSGNQVPIGQPVVHLRRHLQCGGKRRGIAALWASL